MVDVASFQAVASGFQSAGRILQSILELRDAAKIHAKAIELQAVILDAQSQAMNAQTTALAQISEIRELKERIVQMENWEREKQRYELKELKPGVFAYALKPDMSNGEPAHNICAQCYQSGVKAPLQAEVRAPGLVHVLVCHRCNAELITGGIRQEQHHPRPRGR
jgi:hypothetical protein